MIAGPLELQELLLHRLAAWLGARNPSQDWTAEFDKEFQLHLAILAQFRTPCIYMH